MNLYESLISVHYITDREVETTDSRQQLEQRRVHLESLVQHDEALVGQVDCLSVLLQSQEEREVRAESLQGPDADVPYRLLAQRRRPKGFHRCYVYIERETTNQ